MSNIEDSRLNRRNFLEGSLTSLSFSHFLGGCGTRAIGAEELNDSRTSTVIDKTSPIGIALIKEFEGGPHLRAYPDGTKNPTFTIGWGHTRNVNRGDVLSSVEDAEKLLREDLAQHEKVLNQAFVGIALRSYQYDALVSANFNANVIGVNRGFAKFITREIPRLNSLSLVQNYSTESLQAVHYLCQYHFAQRQPLDGLLRRRLSEGLLFANLPNHLIGYEEYRTLKELARVDFQNEHPANNRPTLKQLIPYLVAQAVKERVAYK